MGSVVQLSNPEWDANAQRNLQQHMENQRIAEEQRVAQQGKMSAMVADSLNALPLPKDENGNPDINNPAYNDILQRRQKLIGSLTDMYTPIQHANLIQRVGGMLTGNKQHAMPRHDQPLPAMGTGPAALAAQAGGEQAAQAQQDLQNQIPQQPMETVQPLSSPFSAAPANHPLHAITSGIKALGEGLKNHAQAFAHPNIPKPDQSGLINSLAASYADPQQLQHERSMELYGQHAKTAIDVAEIRAQYQRLNTPEKANLDSASKAMGYDSFADAPPEAQYQLIQKYKAANTAPSWKPVEENGKIYAVDARDPSKPKTLIGNKSEITETRYSVVEPQADGTLVTIPMVRYTTKGGAQVANLPLAQSEAAPVSANAPVAPTSGTSNAQPVTSVAPPTGATTGGVVPAAPVNTGARAPGTRPAGAAVKTPGVAGGRVVGYRPTPLDRADVAQYQKVAEDANSKEEAYNTAKSALAAGSTPSSDQELIYSWVRANVQGAGRMTQAEFRQAAQIGSLPLKAQNWWDMTLKGTLAPELEQMMITDIKRSYDTSKAEAEKLRPKSNKAPGSPEKPAGIKINRDAQGRITGIE